MEPVKIIGRMFFVSDTNYWDKMIKGGENTNGHMFIASSVEEAIKKCVGFCYYNCIIVDCNEKTVHEVKNGESVGSYSLTCY